MKETKTAVCNICNHEFEVERDDQQDICPRCWLVYPLIGVIARSCELKPKGKLNINGLLQNVEFRKRLREEIMEWGYEDAVEWESGSGAGQDRTGKEDTCS